MAPHDWSSQESYRDKSYKSLRFTEETYEISFACVEKEVPGPLKNTNCPPDVLYLYQDAGVFTKNMQNIFAFSYETGPQDYTIADRQPTDRKASIFASIMPQSVLLVMHSLL